MQGIIIAIVFYVIGFMGGYYAPSPYKEEADAVKIRMQQDGWVRMETKGNKTIACKAVDCPECKTVYFKPNKDNSPIPIPYGGFPKN